MTSNADRDKPSALHSVIDERDGRSGNRKSPSTEQTEKNRRWLVENADAIQAENAYIEEHGLPFAKNRLF